MNFDKLNERWKKLVLWYYSMETRTQIMLEKLADSGFSFTVLILLALIVLIIVIRG